MAHSTISPDYDAADTLVVSDPAQLRALSDDVRGRIIALLRERAASASELGGLLEMPKGTVGHHLKVLERAGLVHVVRTRRVRAVTEKYYGRVARLFLYKSGDERDDELVHGIGAMSLRLPQARSPQRRRSRCTRCCASGSSAAAAKRFNRRLDKLVDDVAGCRDVRRRALGPRGRPLPVAESLMRRPGGLWRHRDFRNLWTAETISVFGSQFTGLALPLVAVLLLEASAFAVSALVVIEFLPFVLFALPAASGSIG